MLAEMKKLSQVSIKFKKERDELKKKVNEENTAGNDSKLRKELKKSEKRKEELIKEVEDLKVEMTKKDVELAKQKKLYEFLEEALDNKTGKDNRKEKCKLFERGSCPYNERCRHFHPQKECQDFKRDKHCNKRVCMELHKIDPDQDCKFWMEGFCKSEATNCGRGAHDKDKFNTKKRSRVRRT